MMKTPSSGKGRLIAILIVIISVAYPMMVFFSAKSIAPAFFSVLFALLAATKFISSPNKRDPKTLAVLVFGISYSLALALSNSELLLRLYPVAMSFTFSLLFALSLFEEQSLVEQFARLAGKTITENAKRYTRKLSLFWATLLFLNALISLYLSLFASLDLWALYCGLLSYLVFGCAFIIELIYRGHYIQKYGP